MSETATANLQAQGTEPTQNPAPAQVTQPTQNVDDKKPEPFKIYNNQKDFDDHAAILKGKGKTDAEKELLALLGLKPEQKEELKKFKDVYEASLSDAEKQKLEVEKLQGNEKDLKAQLQEKDHIIAALIKVSGKEVSDVDMYIKMARGLVSTEMTFEKAFDKVLETVKPQAQQQSNGVPTGKGLEQPNAQSNNTANNPFIKDSTGKYNMNNISRLVIKDPKGAAVLARAANYPVTWREV